MLQPNPAAPDDIWLILGPQARPGEVALSLNAQLDSFDGPTGQVSVYRSDTGWDSWIAPARRLDLHEDINFRNVREIMGTLATLSPLHFIAATLGLIVVSVGFALGVLLLRRQAR
jgi:hypothetical protein